MLQYVGGWSTGNMWEGGGSDGVFACVIQDPVGCTGGGVGEQNRTVVVRK